MLISIWSLVILAVSAKTQVTHLIEKKNSKLFFKISPDTNATEITSLDAKNVSNQETKLTNEMASERERRLFVSKGFQ